MFWQLYLHAQQLKTHKTPPKYYEQFITIIKAHSKFLFICYLYPIITATCVGWWWWIRYDPYKNKPYELIIETGSYIVTFIFFRQNKQVQFGNVFCDIFMYIIYSGKILRILNLNHFKMFKHNHSSGWFIWNRLIVIL